MNQDKYLEKLTKIIIIKSKKIGSMQNIKMVIPSPNDFEDQLKLKHGKVNHKSKSN